MFFPVGCEAIFITKCVQHVQLKLVSHNNYSFLRTVLACGNLVAHTLPNDMGMGAGLGGKARRLWGDTLVVSVARSSIYIYSKLETYCINKSMLCFQNTMTCPHCILYPIFVLQLASTSRVAIDSSFAMFLSKMTFHVYERDLSDAVDASAGSHSSCGTPHSAAQRRASAIKAISRLWRTSILDIPNIHILS